MKEEEKGRKAPPSREIGSCRLIRDSFVTTSSGEPRGAEKGTECGGRGWFGGRTIIQYLTLCGGLALCFTIQQLGGPLPIPT